MNGILLFDKPTGPSSYDVIRQLKQLFKESGQPLPKIGHAGTLDPLASGLLIVLVGPATKTQAQYMKLDKSYQAEITLGSFSDTDDREGPFTEVSVNKPPDVEEVELVLRKFQGQIQQLPPQHSAAKVRGQRAYKLARQGVRADLKARIVTIHSLKVKKYDYPLLALDLKVSSGTYVRSLARDLGQALGTGAYLSALRRTQIGEFTVDQALNPEKIDWPAVSKAVGS